MNPTSICRILILALSIFTFPGSLLNAQLQYSFVFVGDDRVNPSDSNDPSTANVCELNRMFTEVQALSPQPDYLIILGDLVIGKISDTATLAAQLNGWIKLYKAHPISSSSIQLLVLPGNHEMEDGTGKPSALAEKVWLRCMSPFIQDSNGPKPGQFPKDSINTDQSRLSFSFDHNNDHFVFLNTDPAGWDSHAPTNWLNSDLLAARASGLRHIFTFGHKPAQNTALSGIGMAEYNAGLLWNILENNQCAAYFAGHSHLWAKSQPYVNKTWQVVAGNTGSPPDGSWSNPYYGYTLVNVYLDGSVKLRSMGHAISAGAYTVCNPSVPTLVKDSINMAAGWYTGLSELRQDSIFALSLFPNPSEGNFLIRFSLNQAQQISVKLWNLLGQNVYEKAVHGQSGMNSLEIAAAQLSKGSYFIELNASSPGNNLSTSRIVRKIQIQSK